MPTRRELNRRHPSSNICRSERLRALYEGDELFQQRLSEFLPQRPKEPPEQYALRRKESVYKNYVGPITDYFAALLFSSTTTATASQNGVQVERLNGYYAEFNEDCDLSGTDLIDSMKTALVDATQVKRSWLWLRHRVPESGEAEPENRADFEASQLGNSWLTVVADEQVIDWETDERGNLEWVLIYERVAKRSGVTSDRSVVTDTWHHVQEDRTTVYAQTFRADQPPNEDSAVPLVSESLHRYGSVPVVCLDLPHAIWIANRIASPQLAHFRLSNMQLWGMSRTCYAMPVFKCDSEEAERPNMGAGYGVYLGVKESLEWAAPPVDCYVALADEIKSYKDEIYRIPHTMALGVDNNSAAVGRTAESKQADARSTVVVMRAFARHVKAAMERIYDLISQARGDDYVWSIDGLEDFEADEVPWLVDVLEQVEKAGGVPSTTFRVEVLTRLVSALMPDLEEGKKSTIAKEIQAGVVEREKREAAVAMTPAPAAFAPKSAA